MKNPNVAAVFAALLRDGGSLAYAVAAVAGAPYFLRRKRRLLQKGRSDIEFDRARWTIRWGDETDNERDNERGDNERAQRQRTRRQRARRQRD